MTQAESELRAKYEECVSACADSLYRVAFRLTSNSTLATELVQETYLAAWKSLSTLKDPSRLRAWMFAILRNQYTKLIRIESKNRTAELVDQIAEPEKEVIETDGLQKALDSLDDKYKLPILLVSMEGMTVEQAAKVLDVPRGTILSRLHRGREKLKDALIRDGYEGVNS